jgi:voltage-gated sodium channel
MVDKCVVIRDHRLFQHFIVAIILLAGVVVGVETNRGIVAQHGSLLHVINATILWIFVAEIAVKVLAEGRRPFDFFKDPWNVFDFFIVAVCFMPFDAEYVAVLRLARILRVLKLVTAVPKLQILVGALLRSVPSMGYVSILLLLLFYIYAVVGCFLFGANDPVHFGGLWISMLTLFRVCTLEDWTDVMYIQMYGSDLYGHPNPQGLIAEQAAAQPVLGAFFFVSFVLLGTMIVLNLFIGIIMNSMDEVRQEENMKEKALKRLADDIALHDEISHISDQLNGLQEQLGVLQHRLFAELDHEPPKG